MLGDPSGDRDWVVIGATAEHMKALGFRPVGRDFPVFLHPVTGEEYALARQERKVAAGYRGFEIDAAPTVTLEEDLARRDLTVNAMARSPDGTLIDPFGGAEDLMAVCKEKISPKPHGISADGKLWPEPTLVKLARGDAVVVIRMNVHQRGVEQIVVLVVFVLSGILFTCFLLVVLTAYVE